MTTRQPDPAGGDDQAKLAADAARRSFDEDHSLGRRSWGKGRHESFPTTEGAEGRNWAGE
jgi:hypothetical protein